MLCNVFLQIHCSDLWVWLPDPLTGYTVKGAYTLLAGDNTSLDVVAPNAIWQRHISLKVSLFIWCLVRDRVPTKDNFYKCCIIFVEDQLCISGCGQLETVGHLFLDCSLFGSLWYDVYRRLGIVTVFPINMSYHLNQFGYFVGISKSYRVWMVMIWSACI